MIRAVILDVLGTLVELLPPAPRLRSELRSRGIEVGEDAAAAAFDAEIAYYLAHQMEGGTPKGLDDLRDRCAHEVRCSLGLAERQHPEIRAAMLASLRFSAFPDAVPALESLRSAGLRRVAASNWDCSLPDGLAGAGLGGLLDGAVSSAAAGAPKPEPAVFLEALELAGCEPGEALFAGDSIENDVEGALACGMRAVLVLREGRPPRGVVAVRALTELPGLAASLT